MELNLNFLVRIPVFGKLNTRENYATYLFERLTCEHGTPIATNVGRFLGNSHEYEQHSLQFVGK